MNQLDQLCPPATYSAKCARHNDDCRWQRGDAGNFRHMMTCGVQDLLEADDLPTQIMRRAQLQAAIRSYAFKPGDGLERDFGSFVFMGEELFFKIDYYDRNLEWGSPDPEDASVTIRVMTVMLASKY